MTLLLPNDGERVVLSYFFNKTTPTSMTLRLFQNNITPAEADVIGTYTEATWTGYAAIALAGASWTVTEGAPSDSSAAEQTFTSTAGSQNQDNYGYYLSADNEASPPVIEIRFSERFTDGPYNIANNGDAIKITPKFTMD